MSRPAGHFALYREARRSRVSRCPIRRDGAGQPSSIWTRSCPTSRRHRLVSASGVASPRRSPPRAAVRRAVHGSGRHDPAAARHRDFDRRFDAPLGGPAMRCCRYASASRTSGHERTTRAADHPVGADLGQGRQYLSGFLGKSRVIACAGEPDKHGNETWESSSPSPSRARAASAPSEPADPPCRTAGA